MMAVVEQRSPKGAFLLLFFVLNAMTDVREKLLCKLQHTELGHGEHSLQLDFWDFIEITLINQKVKRKIQSASRW